MNVEITGLTRRFGRTMAVAGVDLQAGPGVFGLLGPNGWSGDISGGLAQVTPTRELDPAYRPARPPPDLFKRGRVWPCRCDRRWPPPAVQQPASRRLAAWRQRRPRHTLARGQGGARVTAETSPAAEVALLDGVGQAELVARGEVTAAELVGWAIERIERLNPALNAVVTPMFDDATAREFFTGVDVWLTPTLSEPPAPIGEIVSTETEPLRALERGGRTVAYSGVIANITGQPAMSVPLWQNADGIPVGVHFLGRFGDEATLLRLAAQLEQARPWMSRKPGIHA